MSIMATKEQMITHYKRVIAEAEALKSAIPPNSSEEYVNNYIADIQNVIDVIAADPTIESEEVPSNESTCSEAIR